MNETNAEQKTKIPLSSSLSLSNPSKFSRAQLLFFGLVFAVIGGYLIYHSFAASPLVASQEAEQMSLPAGASVISDPTASGGKAIKLTKNGVATSKVNLPSSATSLSVVAEGGQCSGTPDMTVLIDGIVVMKQVVVSATAWTSYPVMLTSSLAAGSHTLKIEFINQLSVTKIKAGKSATTCSRSLSVDVTDFYGPTPLPPTVTISASPTSVTAGQSSTLNWTSSNTTSCTASGAWSGSQQVSGTASTGILSQNSSFNLSCSGAGGTTSASTVVTVTPASAPAPTPTATLGNTTVGSNWTTGLIADDRFVEQFSMPQASSISKLSYYLKGDISSSQVAKAIIYADNNGSPGALLAQGSEATVAGNQAAGWVDFSFASPVNVPAGKLWIGLIRGATSGNIDVATNYSGGVEAYSTNTYASGASNPFGTVGGTSTYAISGYATYTPTPTATLGNTTVGSNWTTGLIADDRFVEQFSMPQASSISKLSYYLKGDISSSQVAKAIIYADNNGSPGALLAQGSEATVAGNQAAGWVDFSFASPVNVPAGKLWIGLIRGATSGNIDVATNYSGGVEAYSTNTYASGASNPFGTVGGTSTYAISGYATYTPGSSGGGGGSGGNTQAPTINMSAAPSSVTSGSASTLTWSSTNATSCIASGSWNGEQPPSGSVSTGNLTTSSTYNLSCSGLGGSATSSASVTVTAGSGGGGGSGGSAFNNPLGIIADGDTIYNQTHLGNYSYVGIDNDPSEASVACGLPNTKGLVYFAASDVNQSFDTGVPWSTASANGWLLSDSSGNLLVNQGYPSNNVADVGNPSFQQAWISNVVNLVQSYHCQGVEIDDVLSDIAELTGEFPTKYPTQAAWQSAILGFMQSVGTALKADGIYVLINASGYTPGNGGSDDGTLDAAWYQQLGPYVNGLMDEYFQESPDGNFTLEASSGGNWYDNWNGWENLIAVTQNMGDDLFANMDQPSGGLSQQALRYGDGSFLLNWNGGTSVWSLASDGSQDIFSESLPPLVGTPKAAATQPQTGVWERTFTNGRVIVNTTNSTVSQDGQTIAATDAYIGP